MKNPNNYEYGLGDFKVGQRAEAHPATDAWMMGDRFGLVVKIGRTSVHVKMDRSGKVRRFHPSNLLIID